MRCAVSWGASASCIYSGNPSYQFFVTERFVKLQALRKLLEEQKQSRNSIYIDRSRLACHFPPGGGDHKRPATFSVTPPAVYRDAIACETVSAICLARFWCNIE